MENTKKNWTVEPLSPWELAIVDENEDEIFLKPLTEDVVTEKDWETFQLASSAPELLEALQEAISCLDRYCIPEKSEELKTIYLKSKSAIGKALGIKE